MTTLRLARAAAALLFLAAPAVAKLKVVTTTTDLADIARDVGGDLVDVSSIASGTQDAHFIEAKPSTMLLARKADLLVEVGMELEIGWVGAIVEGARNAKIDVGQPGRLDASTTVHKLEVPTGTVDRSMGDVHALGNPHYWLDPWNVRLVADAIATRLGELDAPNAAKYRENATAFQRRVDEAMFGAPLVAKLGGGTLWIAASTDDLAGALATRRSADPSLPPLGGWAAQLMPYKGQGVFTYHRSWSYLIDRFGLRKAGEIEPKPGIPPTPGHLMELVNAAKTQPVKAILVEPFYNDQAPKLVASQIGATVLRLPLSVGGDDVATDWFALMDHVVGDLAAALGAGTPPHA
jgi:zinc/manganese transport system substrate-binding protein